MLGNGAEGQGGRAVYRAHAQRHDSEPYGKEWRMRRQRALTDVDVALSGQRARER